MTPRRRAALRVGVGLGLLVAVIAWLDTGLVRERLATADLRLAAPAIVGLVAVHLVAALTWRRLTLRLAGVRLDRRSAVRLWYAGQAVAVLTPANLGADVYRVLAAEAPAGRVRIVYPIVVQRLTSIVALIALGVAGAALLPFAGSAALLAAALIVAGTGVAAGAFAAARRLAWRPAAVRIAATRASTVVARFGLRSPGSSIRALLADAARDGVGLGLLFHGLSILFGLLLVAAVEPAAVSRPHEVVGALAVARLSLAIPISPNGIGVQEAALSLLFVGLGLGPDIALASALLGRIGMLGTALVGAVALMAGSPRSRMGTRSARGAPTSIG